MALSGSSGGSARAIEAGKAVVRIGAKNDLSKQLKAIGKDFLDFGKTIVGLTGIGGIVSGVLGGLSFKDTVDDLTKMRDAIRAMDMGSTGGSGLLGVLNQFSDLGENVEGLTQFNQKVKDAFDGVGEEPKKLFKGLSVSAKDLIDLPLEEKFLAIHGAIRELPQAQQLFKLSMLGGTDSMKKWLPLLDMSNAALREQAKRLAFGSQEMEEAAAASRAMKEAGTSLNRVWQQLVIMGSPVVRDLSKGLTESMKPVVEWMKGRSLEHVWAETVARFKLGWEQVKQMGLGAWLTIQGKAEDAWFDIEATAKVAFIDLTEFMKDTLSGKDLWAGMVLQGATQFNVLAQLFDTAIGGMVARGIAKVSKLGEAMLNPMKAADAAIALAGLPVFAPLLAGDEIKKAMAEADADFRRQMEEHVKAGREVVEKGKGAAWDEAANKKQEAAARRALELLKGQEGVDDARTFLNAELARLEAERKKRQGDDIMDFVLKPASRAKLSAVERAVNTFGVSGGLLAQGFGVQSGRGAAKETVDQLKKANVTLRDVVKAINDTVPKFL